MANFCLYRRFYIQIAQHRTKVPGVAQLDLKARHRALHSTASQRNDLNIRRHRAVANKFNAALRHLVGAPGQLLGAHKYTLIVIEPHRKGVLRQSSSHQAGNGQGVVRPQHSGSTPVIRQLIHLICIQPGIAAVEHIKKLQCGSDHLAVTVSLI